MFPVEVPPINHVFRIGQRSEERAPPGALCGLRLPGRIGIVACVVHDIERMIVDLPQAGKRLCNRIEGWR
ncbi:MAG: hypothetical protein BWY63_02984 [Chloroflexi bacterium ADurb.Bin360]|nr:MAG: hypothetical protein BWY63_02984 [Chloroflexi bacterium ADurb.Bin360]